MVGDDVITLEELLRWDEVAKDKLKEENKGKKKGRKKISDVQGDEQTDIKKDKLQDKLDLVLEDDPDEVQSELMDNWKPYLIENSKPPKFEIPQKKSNNFETYKRSELSRILTFIEFAQRKRFKGGCTVMPIPTTSRKNLMIWGYPKAISRGIEFMKEIGLITVHDDSYRFGVPYKGGNYGKLYGYHYQNEKEIIQYCKENNIHKYVIKNLEEVRGTPKQVEKIESAIEFIDLNRTFEIESVRFKKNLELEKPDGVSVPDFEAFLTCCLYINYPEFAFHQTKADEINERFYENYPEFKLRFRPHFRWKGNKVVKIGIRLSNEFCNKEKEERKLLLDQYGFHLEKDVRSSVPRLTLSINEGHWIDEEIDIYELINNEFDPGSEFNEVRRDAIKHYMLRTYFDLGSNKELGRNVMSNINQIKLDIPGVPKVEVDELMGRLRDAARKVLGGRTFGSDIFYVESCVYLMTLYDLLTSGHMVWLVYDAFYSNGEEDDKTFKEMVANSVRLNYNYFMETSTFKMFSKVAADQEGEIENKIAVRDILEKYNLCVSEGDI